MQSPALRLNPPFVSDLPPDSPQRGRAYLDFACAQIEADVQRNVRRYHINRTKSGAREFLANPWRTYRLHGELPIGTEMLFRTEVSVAAYAKRERTVGATDDLREIRLVALRQLALALRWARRNGKLEG